VLLRLPERGWPLRLPDLLDGLDMRGFGLILAEPERCDSLQRSPDRLREIVGRGALVLTSARSLKAEHGPRVRWTAANLLRGGLVHLMGSGGDSLDRPPVMDDGLAEAAVTLKREPDQITWLVQDGPAAVLAGGAVRAPRISLHRGNPGAEPPAPPAKRPRSRK
jgi:tyrosine-protein phosphatase YwqE